MINGVSDVENEEIDPGLILFYRSLDSLEEELNETFEGILIHMINDAEGNAQEIEHSTLGSDRPVDLSLCVDIHLGNFGNFRLLLNLVGSGFCLLQVVNEFLIVQDSCWIGIR